MRLTNWIALLPCSAALSTALLGACTQQTAPFVEAVHSPLPLMQYQGGPLITSPRIFTVSFADDAHQSDEQRFDDQLTTSVYWKSVTDGYCDGGGACIGPGVSAGAAVLPQSAATLNALTGPSDFADRVLGPALANGTLPPTADDLLYVFYVPTDSPLGGVLAGGYHGAASFPPSPGVLGPVVRYAVVKGYNLAVAAHEIVESATDWDGAAWIMPDSAFASYFFGDEVGDICALDNYVTTDAGTIARMWSHASAIAGHNPCVPGPPRGDLLQCGARDAERSLVGRADHDHHGRYVLGCSYT